MSVHVFGPAEFQDKTGVSVETLHLYERWHALLTRWNSRINLIASSTLADFWLRHALDSHQVHAALPAQTKNVIDLGAGAGFPGIALAILLRDTPGARVTMVESNGKKCNFLRTAIRELSLPAEAVQDRAEHVLPQPYDVVTARAFAPLPRLLSYAHPFWHAGTLGVFPKGESWETEINEAQKSWDFDYKTQPSLTDDQARILTIDGLRAKSQNDDGGMSIE